MSFIPSLYKTIEAGSLSLDAVLKTLTLTTPVPTGSGIVIYQGSSQGDNNTDGTAHGGRIKLTDISGGNYTKVTAEITTVAVNTVIIKFIVLQFRRQFIKSIQHFTVTGSAIQTITSVVVGKTILINNGETTTDATANMQTMHSSIELTSATQITVVQGAASTTNFTVIEFR